METSIISGAWHLTRKIGQGERENVRAGLFQVLLVDAPELQTQLLSSRIIANRLGHRLRVFLNHARAVRLGKQAELQMSWMHAVNDDLMLQDDLTFEEFIAIYRKVDIVIETFGDKLDKNLLEDGLVTLWKNTGGRGGLLGGRGAWISEEEQNRLFPDVINRRMLWNKFISHR